MHGDYLICTGMYGNGVMTGMGATAARVLIILLVHKRAPAVWGAAAVGVAVLAAAGQPIAPAAPRTAGTAAWASGLPGVCCPQNIRALEI